MTGSNIASAINAAHAGVEAAKREGARYAVECGRLLMQAKEIVPHGGWDAVLCSIHTKPTRERDRSRCGSFLLKCLKPYGSAAGTL